jgi:hypothetical protein
MTRRRRDARGAPAPHRRCQTPPAANSKRVPTLLGMNASGKRAASAWVARQPVQCAGTRWSAENSASASQVGPMIGSNARPLRWKPPMTAWIR